MYCRTEQRRTQRFYIAEIVRHRGTVGAWRNRGYLRVFIKVLQQFGVISFEIRTLMYCHTEQRRTQRHRWYVEHQRIFVSFKNVYYQSYQQHVHYGSVALCAFGTSVRLSVFTSVLSPSLCDLLYVVGLIYHSIFRKNQIYSQNYKIALMARL